MYRVRYIGAPPKRKHLRGYLPIKINCTNLVPLFRWARYTKCKYCCRRQGCCGKILFQELARTIHHIAAPCQHAWGWSILFTTSKALGASV